VHCVGLNFRVCCNATIKGTRSFANLTSIRTL
jgi:hypothetical protein